MLQKDPNHLELSPSAFEVVQVERAVHVAAQERRAPDDDDDEDENLPTRPVVPSRYPAPPNCYLPRRLVKWNEPPPKALSSPLSSSGDATPSSSSTSSSGSATREIRQHKSARPCGTTPDISCFQTTIHIEDECMQDVVAPLLQSQHMWGARVDGAAKAPEPLFTTLLTKPEGSEPSDAGIDPPGAVAPPHQGPSPACCGESNEKAPALPSEAVGAGPPGAGPSDARPSGAGAGPSGAGPSGAGPPELQFRRRKSKSSWNGAPSPCQ